MGPRNARSAEISLDENDQDLGSFASDLVDDPESPRLVDAILQALVTDLSHIGHVHGESVSTRGQLPAPTPAIREKPDSIVARREWRRAARRTAGGTWPQQRPHDSRPVSPAP